MQAELNFDSSSATLKQDEAKQLHLGYLEAEPDLVETRHLTGASVPRHHITRTGPGWSKVAPQMPVAANPQGLLLQKKVFGKRGKGHLADT